MSVTPKSVECRVVYIGNMITGISNTILIRPSKLESAEDALTTTEYAQYTLVVLYAGSFAFPFLRVVSASL